MKKEIIFSTKLETQDFDRTVEVLQRKIKEIYRGSDQNRAQFENRNRMGAAGIGRTPTSQDKNRQDLQDLRTRRELDTFIKQQVKDQEKLSTTTVKQLEAVRMLRKEQEIIVKLGRDDAALKEKILTLEKNIASSRGIGRGIDRGISDALDRREEIQGRLSDPMRIARGFQRGGIGRGVASAQSVWRNMGMGARMGAVGGAMGAAGAAISGGANIAADFMDMPRQTLSNYGGASGFYNQQIQRAFGGKNYENVVYAPEMMRARQLANTGVAAQRTRDVGGLFGGMLMAGGTGAAIGGATGALAGGVGAVPGALAGGLIGAGGYALANGSKALGMFGVPGFSEKYESGLEAQKSQMMQEAFESQKSLNVFKRSTVEDFGQNMGANLGMQRQLGLSDAGLSGMFQRGTGAGFTRGMQRDMASSIIGAGGSTRSARDLGTLGLRLGRDNDLTNAGSIIGRLGGTMGGAGATEQATMKLLTEGVKQGLDNSDFREENRKFTQQVADIVFRSGAREEGGAGAIAALQGGFLADKTTRGIEAAGNMQQFTAGLQTQQGGLRASIEAGYMFGNKGMGKLSTDQMLGVQGMSEQDIASLSGPELDSFLKKTGMSRTQFMRKSMDMKLAKTLGPNVDIMEKRNQLTGDIQEAGLTLDEAENDPRFRERIGEMQTSTRRILPAGTAKSEVDSFTRKMMQNPEAVIDMMGKGGASGLGAPSGRVGDAVTSQQAAFEGAMNAMQRDFTPSVIKAAEASKEAAKQFSEAADMLKKAKTDLEVLGITKKMSAAAAGMQGEDEVQPQGGALVPEDFM